jgi:hypothetical protein
MAGPGNVCEESAVRVAAEELVAAMEQEVQQYLQSVMQVVNDAPDGEWISGSEESVRNLSADFRRRVFQRAVQMRVDAAEAAFPPSDQRGDGQASGE